MALPIFIPRGPEVSAPAPLPTLDGIQAELAHMDALIERMVRWRDTMPNSPLAHDTDRTAFIIDHANAIKTQLYALRSAVESPIRLNA